MQAKFFDTDSHDAIIGKLEVGEYFAYQQPSGLFKVGLKVSKKFLIPVVDYLYKDKQSAIVKATELNEAKA